MKKIIAILLACAMLVSLMTACASHSHTETGNWVADTTTHWMACTGCDEKLQEGAHTLDDMSRCAVCSSETIDWGGSVSVYTYDKYENMIRMAEYDDDVGLYNEIVYDYVYDADGNIVECRETVDGRLTSESEYTMVGAENVLAKVTYYNEDGTWFINVHDSYGNVTSLVDYDADGNVTFHSDSTYAQNSGGEWYTSATTEFYSDGMKLEAEYNEYGDITFRVMYDADGNVSSTEAWEYSYDEDGRRVTQKTYTDGMLCEEMIFKTVTEEDGWFSYPEIIITYSDDGSRTVCVYNENNELVSETTYDGSTITEDEAIELVRAELGEDFSYIPADELTEANGKQYYAVYVKMLLEQGNYTTMATYYVSTDGLEVFDRDAVYLDTDAPNADTSIFAFSGNGGSIQMHNYNNEEYKTVAYSYALEYGQALNDVMGTEYGDAITGMTKDGAEFLGWTLYMADEITWSNEEIYDTEILCLLYNDSGSRGAEYALLKNGSLVGEYMPTEQLCGMTAYGENYLAVAIWSE